ncbi:MAG: acetylxylan esterase [Lentimicrobium sp.]|nr:acetylxylan esterase [Lentimicrobium sp.]
MKKLIFLLITALLYFSLQAQNLLGNQWKFSVGDDSAWISPGFDDSKWVDARIGKLWENWGFKDYDGFGWYRQQVVISSKYKKAAEKNGGLTLRLARIDDVDFTYFNGTLIGKNGDVPPNYDCKYDVDRVYSIPADLIKWDKPNTISVRVFDYSGGGGIYGDDISLVVCGKGDLLSMAPAFAEPDRVLKNISALTLPIEIHNNNPEKIKGILKIVVRNDFFDTVSVQESNISIAKRSVSVVSFPVSGLQPGIFLVTAYLTASETTKQVKFNFAVDPEKMTTIADAKPDFAQYWQKAKSELAAVDPQYKLIKIDSLSTDARDCYLVEMRSLGNVLVRAWLLTPKKPGKYPAVLTVQGFSSDMQSDWTFNDDNVVSLGLNIRGHGNSRDDVNPGFPGFLTHHIENKEQYIYRGAYMDCLRAIDFLFSRPEVDTNRVAVEGGSQGGALSFATAALCGNRIKVAVPLVPFLSDFPEYIKIAEWPANEWNEYAEAHPEFGIEGILNTLSYIDIKNLAPWITASVFMAVGLVDVTCPPRINFAAYNNLKTEKKYIVYPNSGHGLPAEFNKIRDQYIREKLDMITTGE